MNQRPRAGKYLEILLFTLSAVLLYRTRVGIFLFLVPIQIVASRRGIKGLLAAAGLFLVANAAIQGISWLLPGAAHEAPVLVAVEAIVVGGFLGGLLLVNAPLRRLPRTVHKLGAAALLAGIVAVPTSLWLAGSPAFQSAMSDVFAALASALSDMSQSADVVASSLLSSLLEPGRLKEMAQMVLLRSVAASSMVLLTFSWWAGQAVASRAPTLLGLPPRFRFAEYRLESWWLWPFIGTGALVLLDLFMGLGPLAYVVWNAALIVLFLFGLQGLAILRFLFEKYRIPRIIWPLAIVVGGSLFFRGAPAAALIVALVVPVFGVSENWIRYRVPRRPEPSEES